MRPVSSVMLSIAMADALGSIMESKKLKCEKEERRIKVKGDRVCMYTLTVWRP